MLITVREAVVGLDGKTTLQEIDKEQMRADQSCTMAIDCSSNSTGIALQTEKDATLKFSVSLIRETGETPVQYKVRYKSFVKEVLRRNRDIQTVFYEEPFIGHPTAVASLYMLRSSLEELKVEYEEEFGNIDVAMISNSKWKGMLFDGEPGWARGGTSEQKKLIRKKMEEYMPFLSVVTEDEVDAAAMGRVCTLHLKNGTAEELESKPKPVPFLFESEFLGGDCDEAIFQGLLDACKIPDRVLENGIVFDHLKPRANFKKTVYELMGEDDKLLIIRFPSDKHANVTLEYRIGHIAYSHSYIYAVIWRKYRKR